MSKAKMADLVSQADPRADSATGYEEVNYFYHEGSWRTKGADPVGNTEQWLTLQYLNTRFWGKGGLMKNQADDTI